jgi:chromate reductase, NAD(P)H dehydrogenase (quinone)
MAGKKVGVIVGSIRKGSYTRMVAKSLCGLNPDLQCEILEIAQVSTYNQDLEESPPRDWVEFRDRIRACDAILFATPEYNRSIPGVLKNAIDVASRPYGKSAWAKKPCAVVSVSPGAIGGFGANRHLRQCLVFLEMPCLQQEAYIGHANKLFDAEGKLTNEDTRAFFGKIMQAFGAWIETNAAK